ncbi:SKA complex subunit 3 [Salarias fasciatus]|uniref:SKA complex subunit 3 n=1 Tax=Salarias fasciatus TaxID=181472 RepID=UPI001176F2EF|nr:spindle and kinetochore-associated protein 3 [Salarias fasciatus]
MDPTTQFFSRLRKLAVTLETETAKLQQDYESRNAEDSDGEKAARAMRAYHELNSDVRDLTEQVRGQLAEEEARGKEVRDFIKACRVTEKRLAQDVHTLKTHWEKYGYQAPRDTQKASEAEGEEEAGEGNDSAEEKEGSQEEDDDNGENPSSPPPKSQLKFSGDVLQTPKLSDFGLSDLHMRRVLAGVKWSSEVPPMPQMSFPQPSLDTPAPPMPLTPKCALRMDEEELRTPQMSDFGISEHTMSLYNDFTMNLLRKDGDRKPQDAPPPPLTSGTEGLPINTLKLDTPEPPALCTPGLKIRKTNAAHSSSAVQVSSDLGSPCRTHVERSTPEVPVFQSSYVNQLFSMNKRSALQNEAVSRRQAEDDGHTFDLPTPQNGAAGPKPRWEYNVPDVSLMELPPMPRLESALGQSLISKNAKQLQMSEQEKLVKDASVSGLNLDLDLDGPTQEFSLRTPRIRMNYQDPSTPEMPELSSVTQDICKLVSQTQQKKTKTESVESLVRPGSDPHSALSRAASLPDVSEKEFQSLPSYLRQMSLSGLNAAVRSINRFIKEHRGEVTELQTEELKSVIGVGTTAPVYFLCLVELKRLHHVGEFRNTSVYRLTEAI